MNALKIALLGTAALAAVSVSARADDLSNLKAQIEALNAQVAATADAPAASATVITWSGNVAAGIVYRTPNTYIDVDTGVVTKAETNIRSKWGLGVRATTDTEQTLLL
jgi:protein-disulfide isomerase